VRRDLTWGHVSPNVCDNRNMRGVLAREPTRAPREITWRKQSDRSVNLRHRIRCQIASHIQTARVTSHELTWREDSVSPVLDSALLLGATYLIYVGLFSVPDLILIALVLCAISDEITAGVRRRCVVSCMLFELNSFRTRLKWSEGSRVWPALK
jgi:hypothetical protein